MKRMITQELINKVKDLLDSISSGVFAPNKISLDSVEDLEISDLGALFPTAENGKFLVWNNGVLKNVDFPVSFTHSFAELDETLQGIVEDAIQDDSENGVACSEAQWNVIKALLDKSLYLCYDNCSMIKCTSTIDQYCFGNSKGALAGMSLEIYYDMSEHLLYATNIQV